MLERERLLMLTMNAEALVRQLRQADFYWSSKGAQTEQEYDAELRCACYRASHILRDLSVAGHHHTVENIVIVQEPQP